MNVQTAKQRHQMEQSLRITLEQLFIIILLLN